MVQKTIVILYSGKGTLTESIIETINGVKFISITTNYLSEGFRRFSKKTDPKYNNLFCYVQQKDESNDDYFTTLANILKLLKPDLIVLAGFFRILPPIFINKFKDNQIINIHQSILPKYKGLYGIKITEEVLKNKDNEHGFTIHYVTNDVDSGPIIFQFRKDLDPTILYTPYILQEEYKKYEAEHYPKIIEELLYKNYL